ncbi:unnamed protein product, partial [Mesorhabditis spiculigera]
MKTAPQKQRRNERERNRVNQVNNGFNQLRDRVPTLAPTQNKKMSKVETLREAVKYIQYLQCLLHNEASGSTSFDTNSSSSPLLYNAQSSPASSSYFSDNSFDEQKFYTGQT